MVVQPIRQILFRRAPNARLVNQKPFADLSLAHRANVGDLCHRSGNWGTTRLDFKVVLNLPNDTCPLRRWAGQKS